MTPFLRLFIVLPLLFFLSALPLRFKHQEETPFENFGNLCTSHRTRWQVVVWECVSVNARSSGKHLRFRLPPQQHTSVTQHLSWGSAPAVDGCPAEFWSRNWATLRTFPTVYLKRRPGSCWWCYFWPKSRTSPELMSKYFSVGKFTLRFEFVLLFLHT